MHEASYISFIYGSGVLSVGWALWPVVCVLFGGTGACPVGGHVLWLMDVRCKKRLAGERRERWGKRVSTSKSNSF